MGDNGLFYRVLSGTLKRIFEFLPSLTLTGPRQSGKTTLCREMFPDLPYANMEDIPTRTEIQSDPHSFLEKYPDGLILDEAQNFTDIFSYIQVEIDKDRQNGGHRRFILTGSNNFSLMSSISQSMAGRTAIETLLPLSTAEVRLRLPNVSTDELILMGGYPAVWNGGIEGRRTILDGYYSTYVERDVRSLIEVKNLYAFQIFIRLLAGRVGSEFNMSSLADEVGVSAPTVKQWVSVLQASYIIYLIHPYSSNIGKRLTKTPKLYFYDSGLACYLLGINSIEQLQSHPLRGNLFENMVVGDMMKSKFNKGEEPLLFFYRDKSQKEVDVIEPLRDGRLNAYEIKSSKTFNQNFFKNLLYLHSILGDRIANSAVIYDGDQENDRAIEGFLNFRSL